MGTSDGSIIAIIITTHMPRNEIAMNANDCPGIRIHAIDIVQPPGIGMPPIADIDVPKTTVIATLATKSSAEKARKLTLCTRRGDGTRRLPRCVPSERDRAIDTSPTDHPV